MTFKVPCNPDHFMTILEWSWVFLGDMPKAAVLYGQPNVIIEQVLILPGFSQQRREKAHTLQMVDVARY